MYPKYAREILDQPLVFGDLVQIRAIKLLNAVEETVDFVAKSKLPQWLLEDQEFEFHFLVDERREKLGYQNQLDL